MNPVRNLEANQIIMMSFGCNTVIIARNMSASKFLTG